jgi:hypothetical protein
MRMGLSRLLDVVNGLCLLPVVVWGSVACERTAPRQFECVSHADFDSAAARAGSQAVDGDTVDGTWSAGLASEDTGAADEAAMRRQSCDALERGPFAAGGGSPYCVHRWWVTFCDCMYEESDGRRLTCLLHGALEALDVLPDWEDRTRKAIGEFGVKCSQHLDAKALALAARGRQAVAEAEWKSAWWCSSAGNSSWGDGQSVWARDDCALLSCEADTVATMRKSLLDETRALMADLERRLPKGDANVGWNEDAAFLMSVQERVGEDSCLYGCGRRVRERAMALVGAESGLGHGQRSGGGEGELDLLP